MQTALVEVDDDYFVVRGHRCVGHDAEALIIDQVFQPRDEIIHHRGGADLQPQYEDGDDYPQIDGKPFTLGNKALNRVENCWFLHTVPAADLLPGRGLFL